MISREYAGSVLVERFAMGGPEAWNGLSLSVYDARLDLWRQTWVDDSGNYWAFVGSLVDGDPSFGMPGPVDAEAHWKRMVFTDITADTFHWRWEKSPDGVAWTVTWEIDYTRR